MSKTDVWEAGLLALVFNNTPFTLLGDAAGLLGSAVAGSLYVSLHTADPGEAGNQTTSEVAYGSYARVAVARTAGGWTVSGSSPAKVSPNAAITFPAGSSGAAIATHVGIGTSAAGAGKLLYKGVLDNPIPCGPGATPVITTATEIQEG